MRPVLALVMAWSFHSTEVHATHAMGGELTYECIGPNMYRVRLNFYRDCNGVAAPSNCNNGRQFRLRSQQCGANFTQCFNLDGVEIVTPICLSAIDRCNSAQGQYGIQRYRYSAVVNLNQWAGCGTDWIIDWDLCCRNNAISSLNNPGDRNLYLYATLNNTLAQCNNSPRYLNDPTPFACVGQTVSYNHGFNDVDGDSLSFELTPALGTNGGNIPYNPGYSYLQPIITSGGPNAVQIDPQTGTITFVPSQQQFSVVTVKVKEWRNGQLIGTYLRDVQFAIVVCQNNNPTVSGINGTNQYSTQVCAGDQVCFTVQSFDPDPGQAVTMTWNAGIPGATFNVTGSPHPTGSFCWTPTTANIGQNLFAVNVEDDACVLNGLNNYGYTIQVLPPLTPVNAGPDQVVCGTSATMAAQLPFPQVQGTWSVVSGSATFANPGSATTAVSGLSIGTNVLRWTVNFGQCGTTFDEVTIVAHDANHPAANAGPDQSLCTPTTSTTLAANAAIAPASGLWTVVAGSGTFANPNSPTTTVSGLGVGTNTFRWTISNGACVPATSDEVTITVFNSAQPAANAGPDQELCMPASNATLAANAAPFPASGTWSVVSGTATFANPNSPTTTVSGLTPGVTVLQWTINNGACSPASTSDQMTITVFDPGSPAANAGPDQAVCASTATLAANAPIAPATGQWVLISGGGVFADPNSPTTTVTGLLPGANVFQWTLNNGACVNGITNDQVVVTRYDASAAVADAGPDQDLCTAPGTGMASTTLAANAPTPPGTGTWSVVSGTANFANPNSPTTTVSGMPPGVHVLAWTIDNGPCTPPTSTDQVTIRVFDRSAPVANAGPDQELCAPVGSVQLAANAATAPGTGQWTVVQGSGTFTDPTSPTTTVTGLALGDNIFRWTLNNGPCPGGVSIDDVRVRVFDPAVPAADAGNDQVICGTGTVTLSASTAPAPATGQWTLVSGTGTIVNPNSPTTTVTGVLVGVSVFQWTVNNGPCGSTTDQVSVTRYSNNNPAADAGPDQSICVPTAPNLVTMAASVPTFPAVGTWTVVSGGGTIGDIHDPATTITAMPVGTNVFRWTVDNGPCAQGVTFDDVIVLVYDAGNPVANAGPDQHLCSSDGSTTMAGSALISPATGQWSLVNGTATIVDPSDPNTAVTGMPPGQHILQWTVNNGPCGSITTDQVSIFVYDPLQPAANAGGDQSLCTSAGNTITLNGSPVIFPATGLWTMTGGPGTIVNPTSPNTMVVDLETGVYSFTWTVNNGVCPDPVSSSTLITVVADGNAQPAEAGPDQSVCGPDQTVTMAANEPEGVATGSWSVVQGTATFSDPTSPTATVSGLSIGVNVLQWNIDNVECGITTDQVSILVFDPAHPPANAGPDQYLCTPVTSTQLQGSALTVPAVGSWSLVQGMGTIANPGSPTTTVSGLGIGENIFQWQVINGVCDNSITTDLVSIFVFASDAPQANAGPDQDICSPQSSVTMAANAPTGSAVGTWSVVSGSAQITDPNSPTTTVSGLAPGVHVLSWSIDNGSCGISTDQVVIRVFDEHNPVADAGPDQDLCTPQTSAALAGSALLGPATGEWTLVSGTGTIVDPTDPNTTVTGLGVGENVFAWTVDNGPCANAITTDQVIIRVFDANASVADAGPDQEWCLPVTNAQLAANTPVFPATGMWSVGAGTAVFADPSDPNTTVSGLQVGTTILVWTVNNGPCDTDPVYDAMGIFIYDDQAPAADAGPDQQLCTPQTSTTLAGSAVVHPATGQWTLVSGSGTIVDPNDPHTAVTDLGVGVNTFRWTVINGVCDDAITFDEVNIVVFDENNPLADAGPDQQICTPLSVATLTGSPLIGPATGMWTLQSGQGTINDPTNPVTTVTGLGVGENIFVWTVSNGPCDDAITSDAVSIFRFDQNNPPANAGPDQSLCTPNTSTAMQAAPLTFPATGIWTIVSGGGTIADPTDPNTIVSGLPVGVNTFAWTVDNGPCATGAGTDQVTITVYSDAQQPADAGPDQQLCTTSTISTTLQANPATFPATGQWTLVSGTGIIVNPSNPTTAVIDIGIGVSVFAWTINNGACDDAITTDVVTVQVFDANTAPASAGPDQDLCTPQTSTTLQASTVAMPGMGTWSIVQGGGTISDVNDPFATISDLQVGVTVLEWTVDNGPCGGITTSQMTITLFDENNPVADAGADQELCTPGGTTTGTTLAGSAVIFPAVGTWTLVSGDAQIADPNDPNSAVTDLGVGVHTFQWTVSNGVCADPVTIDEVTIAVYDADNPVANAGPDQQVCTPVTQAVMGATPAIFPAVGTWTVVSGSGDIQDVNDPLTVITDLGMGTNVFRWTVYNGACPEGTTFDEVTIVLFDANAPPADAGPDQELCYPDTETTLAANPTVGAAVGTWTVVAGTGQFADPNDNTTVVTGLSIGVNTFAWTIESGDCATTTDQVNILVFDPQNADAFAGLDQALCMPQDSVFMAGSPLIAPATGTWTLVSGSGIPVDPNDPLTLIEGLSVGPNVFQWTVYNGVCANSITDDLVTITLYSDSTAAANAGPDLSICLPMTSIFLQAETPPAPAVGTWTLIQGGGTIVNPNDPQTEVIDLQQGNNVFVWTLEWDPCPNNGVLSDTMVVSVFDPFAPVANAGGDQFFCTPVTTTTMAANVPATPGVGSWTVLSGTVEVEDPADPATVVSGLTVGVHELVWTITNGECGFAPPTTADTVRIHVYDGTAPEASTGDDIRWCTPVSSAVLQANDPVFPATGIWTALSGTGTIVDPNDPLTAVLGLGVGQHDFQWTIDNGPCGSSSAIISVFIHDGDSDPADAGADQALCGPIDQAQMACNAPVFPAVGEWTLVSGGGVFADPSDPLSTVTGLQFGDNVFQWTIDNGPCGTTDDLVTITLYDSAQAAADAGPDQQLCTPVNSVNLQANAVVAPATGMWTIVSGTGDISDPTDPQAVITNIGPGVIVLQWSISNGPCTQGPTTDEVTIEIFDGSAAVAAAGPDQSFCTPIVGDVTMFASSPVPPGFGQWELISGTADIADPASPFSAITGLTPGEHIFRWTVHNGACGSTSDEMSIMVYDHTVAAADAGPDQQFCQDVSATQLEAAPTSSTAYGTWTALGSGTIASPNDPGTDVTGLPQGDHWFVWTVHNGDCGTTADTMLVRIKDCLTLVIPDAFSPNGDGVNDTYVIHNLESYPDNSFQVFNRWGNKVLDRSPYNNDWDGTNQFGSVFGEQLPESTYYYVLDLNNGDQPYTGFIYLRR